MIKIYLKSIHCNEETDEVGADEPYVFVTAVDLASSVNVSRSPLPLPSYEVVRYGPFGDVYEGETHFAPGISRSFWSLTNTSATLDNPDNVIFVVAMKENDTDDPEGSRGIVKGEVAGSVFGSLAFSRMDKVTKLINDVRSALRTPSPDGINFDEPIGDPQELWFSREELARAESGQIVSKSLVFSGDGGRYTLTFEARNPLWQGFDLAPAGSAASGAGIAAVSRIPQSLEVWWVAPNGSVQGAYWYEGPGNQWQRYELAPAGSAASGAGIAAVSRIPQSLEVWWVAPNGSVQGAYWYEGPGNQWQRYELASAGSAASGAGIAAVSRIPQSLEVWWVAPNGSVQGAYWYEGPGNQWQRYELAPAGSAASGAGIAAVSRIPQSLEVWWVAPNGSVQGAYWYEGPGNQWQRYELASAGSAASGAGIAAVSRIPQSLEVWWVAPNGSVQGAYWYEGPGNQWQRYELAPAGSAASGAGIAAVSRIPQSLEVWWVAPNGSVHDAYWYEGPGNQWQQFELAPPGSAASGAGIAAVSRIPQSLEVWYTGAAGQLRDTFWYQ